MDYNYNKTRINKFNYFSNKNNDYFNNFNKPLYKHNFSFRNDNKYKSRDQYIFDRMKEEGMTNEGAASIVGNISLESRFSSVKYENAYKKKIGMTDQEYVDKTNSGEYDNFVWDQAGFGLVQWTYPKRKKDLLKFCNGDIGNFEKQVEFIIYELKNYYPGVMRKLKTCNDLKQCCDKVVTEYEKPYGCNTNIVKNKRYNESLKYLP